MRFLWADASTPMEDRRCRGPAAATNKKETHVGFVLVGFCLQKQVFLKLGIPCGHGTLNRSQRFPAVDPQLAPRQDPKRPMHSLRVVAASPAAGQTSEWRGTRARAVRRHQRRFADRNSVAPSFTACPVFYQAESIIEPIQPNSLIISVPRGWSANRK
jgi:hypothetical protein